jgi:hypothetical protein
VGADTAQAPRHAADGRTVADGHATNERPAEAEPAAPADRRDQLDDRTVYRSRAATAAGAVAADRAARQGDAERVETERAAERRAEADRADTAVRPAVVEPSAEPMRRSRTSMLATLGLALGVVAALGVLSGRLAAYGVAVGVVALLLSMAGMSATRRRHVAGKGDGLLGLLLSLGAIVVGILVLTGSLPWLTTDTDTVGRARDWLDTQWNSRF